MEEKQKSDNKFKAGAVTAIVKKPSFVFKLKAEGLTDHNADGFSTGNI